MIKDVVYQAPNKITENLLFNIIQEQHKNVLTQKVKELSENYIFCIGAQMFIGVLVLKTCGISVSATFPILLALVVAKSFLSTLNYVKTAIKTTLDVGRKVIQITTQKAVSSLTRVADIINAIFKRVCASAMCLYRLMRNSIYSSSFKQFNCPLPIVPLKIESQEENRELVIEASHITKDLAPLKPPFCDSQTEETISNFAVPYLKSFTDSEKNTNLASNIEAPGIQEDTQIVPLDVPQKEVSKIEKKAKKSEILYKFDLICAFSSFEASNYTLFYKHPQSLYQPLRLSVPSNSKILISKTTFKKELPRTTPKEELLITSSSTSTLNPYLIKLGMKTLNLAKLIK